jgi:hypothetical protein
LVCNDLWSSNFWIKHPGGKEIPWHQDINYWPLDPPLNVTARPAFDEAAVENSRIRIIPGSHKKALPHISFAEGKWFAWGADMSHVDESEATDIVIGRHPWSDRPAAPLLVDDCNSISTVRWYFHGIAVNFDVRRILDLNLTVP